MVWKILETESKSFIITHQVKSWTAVQDVKNEMDRGPQSCNRQKDSQRTT